jgi:hypothetical protein
MCRGKRKDEHGCTKVMSKSPTLTLPARSCEDHPKWFRRNQRTYEILMVYYVYMISIVQLGDLKFDKTKGRMFLTLPPKYDVIDIRELVESYSTVQYQYSTVLRTFIENLLPGTRYVYRTGCYTYRYRTVCTVPGTCLHLTDTSFFDDLRMSFQNKSRCY